MIKSVEYKQVNQKVLIIGTFDLFHIGHFNLINKAANLWGEENLVISVSSDEWNIKKNKPTFDKETGRQKKIKENFPLVKTVVEKSLTSFSDIPRICKEEKITIIFAGEDHKKYKSLISKLFSNEGLNNCISFIYADRTIGISSTNKRKHLLDEQKLVPKWIYKISMELKNLNHNDLFKYIQDKKLNILNEWSTSGVVIDLKSWICKIFPNDEYNFNSSMREKILHTLNHNPNLLNDNVFLYKKIDGNDIKNMKFGISNIEGVANALKSNFSLINEIKSDEFIYFTKGSIKNIVRFSEEKNKLLNLNETQIKKVYESLEVFTDEELKLCHGDLNAGNVLIDNNEIRLIDYEYSKITNIEWDLASISIHNWLCGELTSKLFSWFNLSEERMNAALISVLYYDAYHNIKWKKDSCVSDEKLKKIQYGDKLLALLSKIINKGGL